MNIGNKLWDQWLSQGWAGLALLGLGPVSPRWNILLETRPLGQARKSQHLTFSCFDTVLTIQVISTDSYSHPIPLSGEWKDAVSIKILVLGRKILVFGRKILGLGSCCLLGLVNC